MLAGKFSLANASFVSTGRSISLCSKGGFSSFAAGALFSIADAALYATADVLYL